MASFKVNFIEERADGKVACDTVVINDSDVEVGHFTVILEADAINSITSEVKSERVQAYKALFSADPRIAKLLDSEAAVAKMEADVEFPITVTL